jgi:hypothetical protein
LCSLWLKEERGFRQEDIKEIRSPIRQAQGDSGLGINYEIK